MTPFVLIDTEQSKVIRFAGREITHAAYVTGTPDAKLVEDFRVSPPSEFSLSSGPEAA